MQSAGRSINSKFIYTVTSRNPSRCAGTTNHNANQNFLLFHSKPKRSRSWIQKAKKMKIKKVNLVITHN